MIRKKEIMEVKGGKHQEKDNCTPYHKIEKHFDRWIIA